MDKKVKIIGKLKLSQISKADLAARQMNVLFGGSDCCGCGCHYWNSGGASVSANEQANVAGGQTSYGGDLWCLSGGVVYATC